MFIFRKLDTVFYPEKQAYGDNGQHHHFGKCNHLPKKDSI